MADTLQPDKKLLNPKFDGYKLAPQQLKSFSYKNKTSIDDVPIKDCTSFSYIKSCQMQNQLFQNIFTNSIYFVDKQFDVYAFSTEQKNAPEKQFEVPSRDEGCLRLPCSLVFQSASNVIASDGSGLIYLVKNGVSQLIVDLKAPSTLVDCYSVGNTTHLFVTSLSGSNIDMCVVIHWMQLNETCEVTKTVKFAGKSLPDAVWVQGDFLNVVADRKFCLLAENGTVEYKEPEEKCLENYTWNQTGDDLSIEFALTGINEDQVKCEVKSDSISVKLAGGATLLEGEFEHQIKPDQSKWFLLDGRLGLHLQKSLGGTFWHTPVPHDRHGVHQPSEWERQQIDGRLDHLTSDKLDAEMEEGPSFNMQQLEECDSTADTTLNLYNINIKTAAVQIKKNLNQVLFAKQRGNSSPLICLRHDVDGVLWQPNDVTWQHVATFDAAGYVRASKREHKFTLASPSNRFFVVTDCASNVFVYDQAQPSPDLHHQYVVSVNRDATKILGACATDKTLFILTDVNLEVFELPSQQDVSMETN